MEPGLTLRLPQFPQSVVHVGLYTSVTNAATIRKELLSGNTRYSYAFVDPRSMLSVAHVLAAVYRALTDMEAGGLRTRTLSSEVVFALGGTMNIADTLRRFGIADDSDSLLVVKVDTDQTKRSNSVWAELEEIIQGTSIPVSDENIAQLTDIETVRKNYKLQPGISLVDRSEATKVVAGAIALRGYL
ncbi:kinase binding protein CGI-121-domain-containing protein [Lipomyces tetrasporus]|uniref:EKC/KEOPS complex subunit CGI121 n=1 Tax=Lipomyces tetrasporus TaxID=54092 RepID=A0AAD7QV61_9ASCO|nr:kinase binding protein CGI-121-domain-containing protein [Lipomyces tetrasporus]KAJ8102089.1 kinase binding protein CGI-121-domain-containing protein [Lipomyces tetrasporus]